MNHLSSEYHTKFIIAYQKKIEWIIHHYQTIYQMQIVYYNAKFYAFSDIS